MEKAETIDLGYENLLVDTSFWVVFYLVINLPSASEIGCKKEGTMHIRMGKNAHQKVRKRKREKRR